LKTFTEYPDITSHGSLFYKLTPRPTQPPTFNGTGNEYRPKCGDALRLGVKASWLIPCGSNVWVCVAGETVWSF